MNETQTQIETAQEIPKIFCFFDTETSDMIQFKKTNSDPSQPWIVQIAAKVMNEDQKLLHSVQFILDSHGEPMNIEAENVHGISKFEADTYGIYRTRVLSIMLDLFSISTHIVAHNKTFDIRMLKIMARKIGHEKAHEDLTDIIEKREQICTMHSTTKLCQLLKPSGKGGYKWPSLVELYYFLFQEELKGAHDAMNDVDATIKCFFKLWNAGYYNA